VNRFLRSALFPVVVITLIVWLGTQTLIGKRHETKRTTYSQVIQTVEDNSGSIDEIIFVPNKHQAEVQMKDGSKF
jgi:hypothetical protein